MPVDQWSRLSGTFGWEIERRAREERGVWFTDSVEKIHFPDDSHDELFRVEDLSFWFRHRNRVIEQALDDAGMPDIFWEVGAGNGCVAGHLQRRGISVATVEPMAAGAINCRRRGIEAVVCGRFEELQLPDECLPAIGCFDVLEHIEKPESLVQDFWRVLQPGGLLVATVPALNWLWSNADVISGHFRRYTKRSFRSLATSVGFEAEQVNYFMMTLTPPMFLLRTLPSLVSRNGCSRQSLQTQMSDTGKQGSRSLMECVLGWEATMAQYLPLPFGTSVIGVFRKPRR